MVIEETLKHLKERSFSTFDPFNPSKLVPLEKESNIFPGLPTKEEKEGGVNQVEPLVRRLLLADRPFLLQSSPSAKTWHGTVAAHITRPWNTTIVGHPTQRETLSFDLRDAPPDNDITEFTSVSGMSRRKISLRPLNYETGLCVLLCEGRIDFIDGNEIEASLIRRDQLQIFLLNCH